MTAEEALVLLDTVLGGQKLRDVQEQVFRYVWQGWTYPEIADQLGYDTGHIRDVGSQLWQQLTQVTGEKVSKNNVQAVLRRQVSQRQSVAAPIAVLEEFATGPKPTSIASSKAIRSDNFPTVSTQVTERSGVKAVEPGRERSGQIELDSLAQWVREQIYDNLQTRCGIVRVLDMSQPIALDAIYITVNLFKSIRRRQRRALAELMQKWDIENPSHSGQTQETIPGLMAVEQYSKLMIFGKPGAGKTTFLKWLGTQCNSGKLWADLVPVFITLKAFAETKGEPELLSYIQKQWADCGAFDRQAAETLLQQGRALILLDGLDEVRQIDHDRVLQEIHEFSMRFHTCRFIVTCRLAAQEYTFEHFTEVEIADFDHQQIYDFVAKWFRTDLAKGEQLMQKLQDNRRIEELATNSLLLTLLCLVFEESTTFSTNRAELYQEALHILLQKWDANRNIKRDVLYSGSEIYQKLSLQFKEALLSQIAFTTFEQGNYCFKQQAVQQSIAHFIQSLPTHNAIPDSIDSEAVLKSIEAQHGLLVERARGIYSFSHLTFQEYFTAKKIADTIANSAVIQAQEITQNLVSHITEQDWREVFLLTTGMLSSADHLLLSMKAQIDNLLSTDTKLQRFLAWLNEKTNAIVTPQKQVTIRAYYAYLVLDSASTSASIDARLISVMTSNDVRSKAAKAMCFSRNLTSTIVKEFSCSVVEAIFNASTTGTAISIAIDIAEALCSDISNIMVSTDAISRAMLSVIDRAIALTPDLNLQSLQVERSLQALKQQLPDPNVDSFTFKHWWEQYGYTWTEQLKQVIVQYRNLDYDWQFTDAEVVRLEQYYRANHLLMVCLSSNCAVTPALCEEIEATLLLPTVLSANSSFCKRHCRPA